MEHVKRDSGVTSNRAVSLTRVKGGRHPSMDAGTSSDTEPHPSPSIGSSPSTQLLELHSVKGHEKPFFNNAWDVDDNGVGPSASVTNNQSRKGRPGFRTRKYSSPSRISPDEFTSDVATQLPQQPVEELQPSFEVEGEGDAEADIDTDFVSVTPELEATTNKRRKRPHFRSRSLRNSNTRLSNPEEHTVTVEGNADADIDTDHVSVVPDLGTAARKKRMRPYSRSRSRSRQNSNTRKNSGPPNEHLDESLKDEFANPVVRSRPIRTLRVDDLIPSPPLNVDISLSQPSSPEQPTLTRSLTRKRRAKNKGRLEVLSKLTDGKVVEREPGHPSNSMADTLDFMRTDEENVDAHINNLERSSAHRVHLDSTTNTIAEQFFYQFLRGSQKMKGWNIVIEQNNGDEKGRRLGERETEDFALISPNSFMGADEGPSFAGSIMLSDQGGSRGPKKKQSLTDIALPYDTPSSGNELVLNPPVSRQLESPLTPEQDTTFFDQNLVLVTAQEHHSWSPPPVILQQSRQVHRDSSQNPKLQISNLPLFELQRSKVTLSRSISTPERTPLTGETSKNYISSRPEVNMEKIRSVLSNGPRSRDFGREHSPCLPGTREGLLKRIHHWVQDPKAPNVATLRGHPGTGKSTLTTSLVRELIEQDILGAHFFCRREQFIQHNPRDLWCLIALKLIQKYPAAAETFALLMEDQLSDPSSLSIEDLFDITIRRPLLSVPADRPIVVVVDALDQFGGAELNSSVRSEMLRSLEFWRGLPTHCRLFITTRGQGDLSTLLKSSANFTLDSGARRSTETDEDVYVYFKSHFSRIAGRFKGLSRAWPSESDIRLLTSSAAGLFIWAKTIVNKVENRPTALSSIVSQVRSGSLAIEGDLTRIYVSILEHVFPGSPIPPSFKLVTSAIISTQDSLPTPLSHLALSRLLSLDEIEVHEICLALQVVLCDEDNPKIFHQSFVDFLVSEYCPPSFRVERSPQLAKNRLFLSQLEDKRRLDVLLEIDPEIAHNQGVPLPDYVLARWRETSKGEIRLTLDPLVELCRHLAHPDELVELNKTLTPWYRIEWCGLNDGLGEREAMEAIAVYSAKTVEVLPLHEQPWIFGVFSSVTLLQSVTAGQGLDYSLIETISPCEARSMMILLDYVLRMNEWSSKHQRRFHRLIKKIALHFGQSVLPQTFYLQDVAREGDHPMAGGGYADIFRGRCGTQEVCLKRVRVFVVSEREKILQEFLNEAIIWRHLRHPNVLPFLGISQTVFPGETCFVSPFIANGNLVAFLKENPDQDRISLLSQVAKGLQYLHSTHICHGDVKAANVLIDENYQCYLADFGIAALISTKTATVGFATATRSTKGTMRWMAPELFDYSKLNTDASGIKSAPRDVYAFACTMLEVITGRPPFPEMDDAPAMLAVIQGQRPPKPASAHMTNELWQLIGRCWAQDPLERPKSDAIVAAFEQMTSGKDKDTS